MAFNNNILKQYRLYYKDNNIDFNELLSGYNLRNELGLGSIYSFSTSTVIESNVTSDSTLHILENMELNNNATTIDTVANDSIIVNNITCNKLITTDNTTDNMTCTELYVTGTNLFENTILISNMSVFNENTIDTCIGNTIYSTTLSVLNNVSCISNLNNNTYFNSNTLAVKNLLNVPVHNCNTVLSSGTITTDKLVVSNLSTSSTITGIDCNVGENCTVHSNINTTNVAVKNILQVTNMNILNNCSLLNGFNSNFLHVTENFVINLSEYPDNATAASNGIPLKGLYRTGGILKVRVDTIAPVITLNGTATMITYIGVPFSDPNISITDNLNDDCITTITGSVDENTLGSYVLEYYANDEHNVKSNVLSRTVNVVNYPTISNITLASNIVTFTLSGDYDSINYEITKNGSTIVPSAVYSTGIDVSGLTIDSTPNIIILSIITYSKTIMQIVMGLTLSFSINPVMIFNMSNPFVINIDSTYNFNNLMSAQLVDNTFLTFNMSNLTITDDLNNNKPDIGGTFAYEYGRTYTLDYTLTDTNGTTINHTIDANVIDTTSPVITLTGGVSVFTRLGEPYVEQGYTVNDTVSGASVFKIEGYVNTNKPGTYYLTYYASDTDNNIYKTSRQINVIIITPYILNNNYYVTAHTPFNLYTTNFTIDFIYDYNSNQHNIFSIYKDNLYAYQYEILLFMWAASSNFITLHFRDKSPTNSNKDRPRLTYDLINNNSVNLDNYSIVHITLQKTGNTYRSYFNGILTKTLTASFSYFSGTNDANIYFNKISIGRTTENLFYLNGAKFYELRIVEGNIYPFSNFTPSITLSYVNNTKVLIKNLTVNDTTDLTGHAAITFNFS